MSKSDFDSGFDLGTSPHGLTAASKLPVVEACQAAAPLSLADGFSLSANNAPRSGAAASRSPEGFCLTDDQRCHLAYAAMCQIEALEESDESEEPEVIEGIRLLNEARHILREGMPS